MGDMGVSVSFLFLVSVSFPFYAGLKRPKTELVICMEQAE